MSSRSRRPRAFLSPSEKAQVEAAIAAAERETSGEIRVMVARSVRGDPLEAAKERFTRLRMHETQLRNGVLIFLAVRSRKFAILGDEGVDRYVGQDGWEHIRDGMADRFRKNEFGPGLVDGVERVSEVLKEHFPRDAADVNELPNDVVEE